MMRPQNDTVRLLPPSDGCLCYRGRGRTVLQEPGSVCPCKVARERNKHPQMDSLQKQEAPK